MENDEEVIAQNQQTIREKRIENLKPYQYKKGQTGNPSGRPKGISLKEYARNKLLTMTDDEREDFFNGLNKDTIWEMGEGKADSKTDITSGGDKLEVTSIDLEAVRTFNEWHKKQLSQKKSEN